MILEHYVAAKRGIRNVEYFPLEQINRMSKELRMKFKNRYVYKVVFSSEKDISWFWDLLEYELTDDETVIEIYSCYKNSKEECEEVIVLNKGEEKPTLEHNRYIVLGNFISGEIINPRNVFEGQDDRIHILALSKDKDNLYMDFITDSNEEVTYCTLGSEKMITTSKNILNEIKRNRKDFHKENFKIESIHNVPAVEMRILTINDMRTKGYSSSYKVHYKEESKNKDIYQRMLFKYYNDRNRIPQKFIDKDCCILRVEMENFTINESIISIELSLSEKRENYPVEESFTLTLGKYDKGKFIEYFNPIDNGNHRIYIDSLELQDPFEGLTEELKIHMRKVIKEGTKLLAMTYEIPHENIQPTFHLKTFLDLPVQKEISKLNEMNDKFEPIATSSRGWIIMPSKHEGINGHKVRTSVLKEVTEIREEEMEVELLYMTKIPEEKTVKFMLNETPVPCISNLNIRNKQG
ncbi:hypothetical protein [Oceanirhabdus sp. W0125-5]|uniref:hypothetical protein n=1 Tax=Oceanirhabdus sp. W0125-5 TaxID=2999116 RepID=UPI0022F2CF2F|nr:hypothetical protein [Oceanirhabdus sp. W0125-5]WBW96549.1 hypothetical protein OW730_23075 [Oceanirhabdus sp. W0125-5]